MTEPHKAYQTSFTKTGTLNTKNRKPYRTASQKELAKQKARSVKTELTALLHLLPTTSKELKKWHDQQ